MGLIFALHFSGQLRIYNGECYSWERFLHTFGEEGLDMCINEWNRLDFCPDFSGQLRIYNGECYSWERFLDDFREQFGEDMCINEWNKTRFSFKLFSLFLVNYILQIISLMTLILKVISPTS